MMSTDLDNSGPTAVDQVPELERTVLSCVLLDPDVLDAVQLRAELFSSPSCRRIFVAMTRLHSRADAVDLVTINDELKSVKGSSVQTARILQTLTDDIPNLNAVDTYARRLTELAAARRIRTVALDVAVRVEKGISSNLDPRRLVEELEAEVEAAYAAIAEARGADVRKGAALSVRDVTAGWRTEGALIHEPTGFETLDLITRGGFVYGTTTVLQGAPNACKTVFSIHLAHVYAKRDIVVGMLASDESASDLVTRLAQRIGFERDDVEKRDHGGIDVIDKHLGDLPIFFFTDDTTIETAVDELVRLANGRRCMFIVDSLQVVTCAAELDRDMSEQRQIAARTIALRRAAEAHRIIVLVTSETSRASYKTRNEDERVEDIAAGKGSGSIEYKAKVLLTMRKVARAPGVYSVRPTKNKLQRDDSDDPFFLHLDRDRQILDECDKPTTQDDADRAEKAEQSKQREQENDAHVARMEQQIIAGLVKANAKGATLTARVDLLGFAKGEQKLKNRALSNLISDGRVRKNGKAFMPHIGNDEPTQEALPT